MARSPILKLICCVVFILPGLMTLGGCSKKVAQKPDYNRPLRPGEWGLRKIYDPAKWPDVRQSWVGKDEQLNTSLDRSLNWFSKASSKTYYPMKSVTHMRGQLSVYAFKKLLAQSNSAVAFEKALREDFDCYTSVGYDNKGSVLFTGYYTPVFKGSRTRSDKYRFPLYKRPSDLVSDPKTGEVRGRKVGAKLVNYPSRSEIETSNMLAGTELVYVDSRLDQYIIQVNGSAKIELAEGGVMYIGFSGTNGHEYTGLGQTLIKEGVFSVEETSLPKIRAHFSSNPQKLEKYIQMNDRFVFFAEYDGANWPAGSMGFKVTTNRSLATDKEVFPRGNVVLVESDFATASSKTRKTQFMVDQDTGGAIRAAGRGDIYYGIGPIAGGKAGRQMSEGRLYYFFLKINSLRKWNTEFYKDSSNNNRKLANLPPGS